MNNKILIIEDQFIEANDLQLMLRKAGYHVCGIANSVQRAEEMIDKERPDLVLLDIFLKGKLTGIDLAKRLREERIAFVYLSANSNPDVFAAAKATQPDGFLVKPFRQQDVLVTLEIARYRHEYTVQSGHLQEDQLQKKMIDILSIEGASSLQIKETITAIQSYIPFDYLSLRLGVHGAPTEHHAGFLRLGFDEYQHIGPQELTIIMKLKHQELSTLEMLSPPGILPACYNEEDFQQITRSSGLQRLIADHFNVCSYLMYPLPLSNGSVCYLSLYSRRPDTYIANHMTLISRIQLPLTEIIKRSVKEKEAAAAPAPSVSTKTTQTGSDFEGIVGSSHLLLNVFDHISRVAPSDTSVLILGESGTGKELIADCIHRLSPRKNKPFIKVNCAALPATLIESELFGHEKGAFTGALDKRIGKFELAADGTIFLDEIGELPFELQVKLLRVLQEKEIERIGSRTVKRLDIRVIAATNRNLEKEVTDGRFRLDLYYRLNVFPIQLPALRERKEDLPSLIAHFVQYFSRRTGKKISGVSDAVITSLMDYHWPGNIRELEHLIERSVLLAKGSEIEEISLPSGLAANTTLAPAPSFQEIKGMPEKRRIKTIEENERDHIVEVLKICRGRIWGPGGAAELLDLPPTTLASRMKKLGIRKTVD